MNSKTVCSILLALLFAGCNVFTEPVCTTEALPAVTVEVRDAVTGNPAAQGATLVVREGAYIDSATTDIPSALTLGAAHERPGIYDVLVQKDGYRDWTDEDVRVEEGECHVKTVNLSAQLEAIP